MNSRTFLIQAATLLAFLLSCGSAFSPQKSPITTSRSMGLARVSPTALNERRWNFNEGQSPWGLKKNAEVWNGRMAQMGFVFVLLQELIQGKGIVQGLSEGDPINFACMGIFAVSVLGLTGWLAIKGDDNYVDRDLGLK